jgi:hypothetical protein
MRLSHPIGRSERMAASQDRFPFGESHMRSSPFHRRICSGLMCDIEGVERMSDAAVLSCHLRKQRLRSLQWDCVDPRERRPRTDGLASSPLRLTSLSVNSMQPPRPLRCFSRWPQLQCSGADNPESPLDNTHGRIQRECQVPAQISAAVHRALRVRAHTRARALRCSAEAAPNKTGKHDGNRIS